MPPRGPGGCCAGPGVPDVRVLDGGYAAWVAAGLPVSTEERRATGTATSRSRPGSCRRSTPTARPALARDGLLLDARAPERYAGETEPIDPVAGHIPGAVNSPTSDWITADGTSAGDLAEHWAAVGGDRHGPRSASTAGRASPPPTRCWPWPSSGSPRCSTPARGASGSATPPARSPPVRQPG